MHPDFLALLACPRTGEALVLSDQTLEDGLIVSGTLRAAESDHEYPIIDGIARLLPDPEVGARTQKSFGLQWKKKAGGALGTGDTSYGYSKSESARGLQAELFGRPASDLGLLLDAGCGEGDKAAALSEAGARVLAFDLTDSVDLARAHFGESECLCWVQADALHPPFRPGVFDTILSIGMLHHTPDARGGFRALAKTHKDTGQFAVWLYPKDRRQVVVWLSRLYTIRDLLPGLQRLPARAIYWLSALVAAGLYPFYGAHMKAAGESRSPFGALLMNTYDFLSPKYQSRHSFAEVENWFQQEGYVDLRHAGTGFTVGTRKGG